MLRFPRKELFESVEFYSEDGLEIGGDHSVVTLGKRIYNISVEVLQDSSLSGYSSTWKMVLKWLFVGDTGEETQHIHYSSLPGE